MRCAVHAFADEAAPALFDAQVEAGLREAGVGRVLSTNAWPHSTHAAPLAPLLAQALRDVP
jgi:hypothetical protein